MKNRKFQIVFGTALGIFLVWFLFRDTDWQKVWQATLQADKLWLSFAFSTIFISFFTRVQRWSYIVRTAKPVSFRHLFSSTQIGFLANFTLPARLGELIRAIVLARLAHLPVSKCFAFVALDRVTDLFGLLAVILVAVLAFRPEAGIQLPEGINIPEWGQRLLGPDVVNQAAMGFVVLMLGVLGAFVLLYLNQRLALRISDAVVGVVSKKLAERVHDMLQHFADGLHVFRSVGDMSKSLFFSLLTWFLAILGMGAAAYAFVPDIPWYTPFLMVTFLSVAITLPGAPGFIGQFHFGIMFGLYISVPTVEPDVAKAVAILAHIFNLIPVALTGLYCLLREQMGLLELQRETEEVAPGDLQPEESS
jgi:hypothetical protein